MSTELDHSTQPQGRTVKRLRAVVGDGDERSEERVPSAIPSLDSLIPGSVSATLVPYTQDSATAPKDSIVSASPVFNEPVLQALWRNDPIQVPGGPFIMQGDQAVVAGRLGLDPHPILVLLDSGASESYIDVEFAKSRRLSTIQFSQPRRLTLFDGQPSSAGPIVEYVRESLAIGDYSSKAEFSLTRLTGVHVVLGYRWLQSNNAIIHFGERRLELPPQGGAESLSSPEIATSDAKPSSSTLPSATSSKLSAISATPISSTEDKELCSRSLESISSSADIVSSLDAPQLSIVHPTRRTNFSKLSKPSQGLDKLVECPSKISRANATPIRDPPRCWAQQEDKLFAVLETIGAEGELEDLSDVPSFAEDGLTQIELDELRLLVPSQYHEFLDLFNPREALETLPPQRDYDMKIDLKPDAVLPVAPLYQLSPKQLGVLKDMLDRERKAGRIQPSNSPYGSPCFFVVRPSDGKYRLVVDYRRINRATIPNAYPLPLIPQVLDELTQSVFFIQLDLPGAYQLLRMAEGHEAKTAFRTPFGMFESKVVRDGLKNAPGIFQQFLNEIFASFLGRGVVVYIDDITIHAKTLDELRRLAKEVFEVIRKAGLYVKASKCKFEVEEIKFLGFRVSHGVVGPDAGYVQGITTFPTPKNLYEVRRFLGMAGYYRRFVPDFAKIARPLHDLTKKGEWFRMGKAQLEAVESLKSLMSTAPVLAAFDPTFVTLVQADASHYGWGFVISQVNSATCEEHPVAIESGSFKGAELNYTVTEKEFLAIVMAFKRKRHLLVQVSTTVITDHLNLTYWMEPRQLNPRQARWVDALSQFSFDIVYRPGKQAEFPDALSRRSDYLPGPEWSEQNLIQALPGLKPISTISSNLGQVLRALVDHSEESGQDEEQEDLEVFLREDVVKGLEGDEDLVAVRSELDAAEQDPTSPMPKSQAFLVRLGFDQFSTSIRRDSSGLLRIGGRMYLPNVKQLRLKALRSCHDSRLAGHPGVSKTLDLIQRSYCWLGLRRDVEKYIKGCAVCQRTKPSRQKPHGLLQPLEIADAPWSSISMDFIEELPQSNGFNSILVVVDRLTKWAIFIPTTTRLTSAQLADLVISHVVCQHGFPMSIVSDRGSKFTSRVWLALNKALGTQLKLSTAYHPQTDGQTERVNQVLEHYLRVFVSYKQDNWASLLQTASFSYNNTVHSATQMSPFLANFGYSPRWLDEIVQPDDNIPVVFEKVKELKDLHDVCKGNIQLANDDYARNFDKKKQGGTTFDVGDQVLLSMDHVQTRRPTAKFDNKYAGPFLIEKVIGSRAYRLTLPSTMKIHPVFHISRLKRFNEPEIEGQRSEPPGPVEVDDNLGDSYEVKAVIDSRRRRGKLQYLVEWAGYEGTDEAATWEPAGSLDNAQEAIAEFHSLHSSKPSSAS